VRQSCGEASDDDGAAVAVGSAGPSANAHRASIFVLLEDASALDGGSIELRTPPGIRQMQNDRYVDLHEVAVLVGRAGRATLRQIRTLLRDEILNCLAPGRPEIVGVGNFLGLLTTCCSHVPLLTQIELMEHVEPIAQPTERMCGKSKQGVLSTAEQGESALEGSVRFQGTCETNQT